ncbi:MAG: hypothetical protein NPIRA06_21760 [Nitrospirales bacterium]|nr:MAG: hypothetical protein NPIRA06_21760 [Nitrospirales bacterium]
MAQDLDSLKAGVVKITTKTGQVGTGFIVRLESEMVYIITAAHVIAGDQQPTVEFYSMNLVSGGQAVANVSVLPGAQVNDDLRGLAVLIVRGKEHISNDARILAFEASAHLVSGGEEAVIIGHPGGGGDWAVVKRDISNRIVHDITLDPGVASRFSGGPIIVNAKVVGMVMTNRGEFGLGITHKSLLNHLDGIGIEPRSVIDSANGGFVPDGAAKPASTPISLPKIKTGKNGAPMVLVPAGEFTMGSPEGEWVADEPPHHVVHLDNFYIDQYEVTVEQYEGFMTQKNRANPEYWDQVQLNRDGQKPVVGINWNDAKAYCEWAGKQLPTEAEWEKAARGTDKRIYPWGDSKPNSSTANFGKDYGSEKTYAEKIKVVGSYEQGKSPSGVYDMAGNVWEWVADWYAEDYYQASPKKNPQGPTSGKFKALRGGSWLNPPSDLRSASRNWSYPSRRSDDLGVRCAQDAP